MFTKAPPAAFEDRWSEWAAGYAGSQTTDGNAALGSNTVTLSIAGTPCARHRTPARVDQIGETLIQVKQPTR